jgi:hypothetical protein
MNVAYGLTFNRAAVDSYVSKICNKLLGTVLALHQFEEFWGVIDKLKRNNVKNRADNLMMTDCSPSFPSDKNVVRQESEQERYVGLEGRSSVHYKLNMVYGHLDATNPKFDERAEHFATSNLVSCSTDSTFYQ